MPCRIWLADAVLEERRQPEQEGKMRKRTAASRRLPPPVGPYSPAVIADRLMFCSGIIGVDPSSGELLAGPFEEQVTRVLENLRLLLEDVGSSLDLVVKTTVFLTNMNDFGTLNEVYARYFRASPPARTTVEVSGLPKGAALEIEAIAVLRD